jgi:hypothetical protein
MSNSTSSEKSSRVSSEIHADPDNDGVSGGMRQILHMMHLATHRWVSSRLTALGLVMLPDTR